MVIYFILKSSTFHIIFIIENLIENKYKQKITKSKTFIQNSLNVSIMDQLSRGVKVEGLTLPPGITLTRVDPNKADGIRANKESIDRVRIHSFRKLKIILLASVLMKFYL